MTPEDAVSARYPHADLVYCEPIFSAGGATPVCAGEWIVLEDSGLAGVELGRGPTEDEAWTDAASRLTLQVQPDAA